MIRKSSQPEDGADEATGTAGEWRYPETAVYDPQCDFETSGVHGPFYQGTGGGWEHCQQ